MNITCPACGSRYAVDDSKIPPSGVSIRCPSCKHTFTARPNGSAPEEAIPLGSASGPASGFGAAVALPGAGVPDRDPSIPLPGKSPAPEPQSADPFGDHADHGDPFAAPPSPPENEAPPSAVPLPGTDSLGSLDLNLSGSLPSLDRSAGSDDLDLGLEPDAPPDLPGLVQRPPEDLPGLVQSPLEDLPGLPQTPADLPGLPQHSSDALDFLEETAHRAGVAGGAGGAQELRIRRRNGRVEGPFGLPHIQALLRAGDLSGNEDVSVDGAQWRAMTSHPTLNQTINSLHDAADPMAFGQVDLVAPAGTDLPAPTNLPGHRAPSAASDDLGLSLDTGSIEAAEAAPLPTEDPFAADPFGAPPPSDDAFAAAAPAGGPYGDASVDMRPNAAKEILEVGEIPELPPIWKTYRKPIIAFGVASTVVLVGVFTQLFTPYGAFGISGAVDYFMAEAPPPAPVAPAPAPPKVTRPEDVATQLAERSYEGYRSVFATVAESASTPTLTLLNAKAAVYAHLTYGDDFPLEQAQAAVARLVGLDPVTAFPRGAAEAVLELGKTRAGLLLAEGATEEALGLIESLPENEDPEVRWIEGLIHGRAGSIREALDTFDSGLAVSAQHQPSMAAMGALLLKQELPERALPWLQRAQRLNPADGPTGIAAVRAAEALDRVGPARAARRIVAENASRALPPDERAAAMMHVAKSYDQARRLLEVAPLAIEAARLDPANAEVAATAAAAEAESGMGQEALARIHPFLQRDPSFVAGHVAAARAHFVLEDVAKAFIALEEARKVAPREETIPLWEGRFHMALGKLRDARESFQRAIQVAKDEAGPRVALGQLELQVGDVERAFELAKDAVEIAPNDARARLLLGDCLAQRGRFERAREAYAAAEQADGTIEALIGQANMLRARASREAAPGETVELGQALSLYTRAWNAAPEDPSVLFELGSALELAGDLGGALSLYQQAASRNQDDVRPHLRMASAFVQQTPPDPAKARASLDAAKAIETRQGKDRPEVRYWEARLLMLEGRAEEAVTLMRRAVEEEPKNAEYQYWLGQALELDNSLFEAINAYETAFRLNRRYGDAVRALGRTSMEQHRYKKAREWFARYRKIEPKDVSVYVDIGKSFTKQNRDGQALGAFLRALEGTPDDDVALLEVGNILSRRGRLRQATERFAQAVAANSDNLEAVCMLGLSLASRRVTPEARPHLDRCATAPEAPEDLQESAADILER